MIEETYVSFETAKLLKEKGFDVETEHKKGCVKLKVNRKEFINKK